MFQKCFAWGKVFMHVTSLLSVIALRVEYYLMEVKGLLLTVAGVCIHPQDMFLFGREHSFQSQV